MDGVSKIRQLKAQRKWISEISAIINRSNKSIYQILSCSCEYTAKHRSGRLCVTNVQDDCLIQRLANIQQKSICEIKRSLGFSESKNMICR